MAEIWRLLDSGLTAPAGHIALSRALLEARQANEIPNTLRFSRTTRCVLLGCQQSAEQALDLEYCRARALPIQRRITGGSAVFLDERQLVWELYMRREDADASSVAKRVCHAAATALCALGADARYRARNDVEVDGRTLGTAGFAVEDDALLLQGMLLLDADAPEAFAPLRTPWNANPAALAVEARKRVVSVREALGRVPDVARIKHNLMEAFESEFDVEFRDTDLGMTEQARCAAAIAHIDSALWVDHIARPAAEIPLLAATHQTAAGVLRVIVAFEHSTRSLKQVWFEGEAPVDPARTLSDLEADLRGASAERLGQRIESFFASRAVQMRGFVPADFSEVLRKATRQRLVAGNS